MDEIDNLLERPKLVTWMIVEDDPATLDALSLMCQVWGYSVLPFPRAQDAMSFLANPAPELTPTIALLDIRLPDGSGPAISAAIRQHPRLRDVTVILMTAYRLNATEAAQVLRESDADDLMYKPLPPMDEFFQHAETLVERRAAAKVATEP